MATLSPNRNRAWGRLIYWPIGAAWVGLLLGLYGGAWARAHQAARPGPSPTTALGAGGGWQRVAENDAARPVAVAVPAAPAVPVAGTTVAASGPEPATASRAPAGRSVVSPPPPVGAFEPRPLAEPEARAGRRSDLPPGDPPPPSPALAAAPTNNPAAEATPAEPAPTVAPAVRPAAPPPVAAPAPHPNVAPSAPVAPVAHLESTPDGAEVVRAADGEPLGTTPCDLEMPASGTPLRVLFLKKGFQPAERSLAGPAALTLDVKLQPQKPRPASGHGHPVGSTTTIDPFR